MIKLNKLNGNEKLMGRVIKYLNYQEYINGREELYHYLTNIDNPREQDFRIAVLEAVGNAVTHGGFPVSVEIIHTEKELKAYIEDSGDGFNVEEKLAELRSKSTAQLFEEKIFNESGRGIIMMLEICHTVIFNTTGTKVFLIVNKSNTSNLN